MKKCKKQAEFCCIFSAALYNVIFSKVFCSNFVETIDLALLFCYIRYAYICAVILPLHCTCWLIQCVKERLARYPDNEIKK